MATMRVVQIARPDGPFEMVERQIPRPGAGTIRIRVQACGICHSDSLTKQGHYPGIQYPRVPGHEVAGVIDAVGAGTVGWQVGQRVGVGWNGGYCGRCDPCRRGEFFACVTNQVTGVTYDGGYADYMIAPASAVARMPAELPAIEAAPLMCAGLTTFNALRNAGARPGDTVAVLGLGGLGHLGSVFGEDGFHTVGIARKDKESLARELGVGLHRQPGAGPAAELLKIGGAKVILATATSGEAMTAVQGGLAINGTLLIVGAAPSMQASPLWLLSGRRSIKGWYSGTSIDSQDTLAFSARTGVRSMNETFPLERASEAYDRMMSGKARFRVVLVIESQPKGVTFGHESSPHRQSHARVRPNADVAS
jgi:D-arabinose 1-dehydrogenase-like Zn-dependent alcohol dehydrogenase